MESFEKAFFADREATMYPEPVLLEPTDMPPEGVPGGGGVSPKEFATGVADTAAAGLKGAVQGWVGLPGDVESLGRMLINLVGGSVDQESYLKTTEDIKSLLDHYAPFKPIGDSSASDMAAPETIGEFVAPMGYVKVIKGAAKAAKTRVGKATTAGAAATAMPKAKQGNK